jgi:hypothetical protein
VRARAFALVLGIGVGALAGCDGETSFVIASVEAGTPDARYEAACAAWAQSLCALDCTPVWTDRAQCVARETLQCELIASDPDVPFDPVKVAACPEPATCDGNVGSFCLPPGRAAEGAPCLWGEGCRSGFCAHGIDPTTGQLTDCGACQRPPCGGSCSSGQRCEVAADGGSACKTLAPEGQPCTLPIDCASFYCAPAGLCAPAATFGKACGDGVAAPPCAGDLYCDGTQHCQRYYTAGYGAPCGVVKAKTFVCSGFGTCDSTDGLCLPPASDGDVCDDSQQLGCIAPARCVGHRCLLPSCAVLPTAGP